MGRGAKIEVQVLGDASSYERAMRHASASTHDFGSKLGGALKLGAVAAAAGLGVVAVAGAKFAKVAMEGQVDQARLDQALKTTHQSVKAMTPALEAAELASRNWGFADNETRLSLAKLETATGSTAKATKDLAIAEDISRLTGKDLQASTQMLTGSMAGNTRAAKALGIILMPVTKNMDDLKAKYKALHETIPLAERAQAKLLDKMATGQAAIAQVTAKVKGQGAAYAETAAGGLAKFHAASQRIQEQLGNLLLPTIGKVAGAAAGLFTRIGSALEKAHGFKAKVMVIWEDARAAAEHLFDKIQAAIFGTHKVIRVGGEMVNVDTQGIDFGKVGRAIADGIVSALSTAKDIGTKLSNVLSQTLGKVNWEQVGTTVGPGIAAGLVAGLATLVDPGFWLRHWQEMLAIALAVVPLGRLLELGGTIVKFLVKPVSELLGPLLGKAVSAGETLVLQIAGRLGPKLGNLFLDAVTLSGRTFAKLPGVISSAIGNLGSFVAGKLGTFKTFVIKALAFDAIIHAATAGAQAVADKIVNGISHLPTLAPKLFAALAGGLALAVTTVAVVAFNYAVKIGTQVVSGVVSGLHAAAPQIASALFSVITNPVAAVGHLLHGSGDYMFTKHVIGKPMAQGVIDGWILGTAALPAKISEKIRTAVEAARAAISDARGLFSTAWSQLTTDALTAFDGATQRMMDKLQAKNDRVMSKLEAARTALTPAEKQLQSEDDARSEADRQQAIKDAQAAVAAASGAANSQAVVAAQKAAAAAKLVLDQANMTADKASQQAAQAAYDQAKIGVEQAQQAGGGDPAALAAAQKQLDDAQYAEHRANLEKQAQAERDARDKEYAAKEAASQVTLANQQKQLQARRDLERRHFEAYLAELETQLEHEGAARDKAQAKIVKMLESYGVSYRQSGLNLGLAFAEGMRESEKAVEKAAEHIARTVAKRLKTNSPTEEGPMSDLDHWWDGFAPALIAGLDTKAIVGAVDGLASGLKETAGAWAAAGMMLGDHFQRGVLDSLASLGNMLHSTLTSALNKAWQDSWNSFVAATQANVAQAGAAATGTTTTRGGLTVPTIGPGPAAKGPSFGGDTVTVNLTVQGNVMTENQLVDTVRTGLIKIGKNNGGHALGGYA